MCACLSQREAVHGGGSERVEGGGEGDLSAGDVLRVSIEIAGGRAKMSYAVNGEPFVVAFSGVQSTSGFVPVVSFDEVRWLRACSLDCCG
jgi:hypothetical protein